MGHEQIWIIGDEFVAMSGHVIEEARNAHANRNFELMALGGNHITTNTPDPIARLRNILVTAFKCAKCIPKIIVVITETSIIDAVNIQEYGLTQHYGQIIEWLVDEHTDIIDKYRGFFPSKVKKGRSDWPFVMWISPCIHNKMESEQHLKRRKFTRCLEKIAHGDRNITALRLLQHVWNQNDERLINDHTLSPLGLKTFWEAVDDSIKFILRRKNYSENHRK